MKKIFWIGVGVVLLVGVGLLVVKERSKVKTSNVESSSVAKAMEDKQDVGNKEMSVGNVDAMSPSRLFSQQERGEDTASTEELSDAVKALLGLDGEWHNYQTLIKALDALDENLSEADVAALRDLLLCSAEPFPQDMRPIEVNAIKNDVLDKLLRQKELPEGIGLQIAEMADNAENDTVWRDYCIQFMEPFYEKRSKVESLNVEGLNDDTSAQSASSADELKTIHDAMFSALDERSETLAGTALIGLELLSRSHEEFNRELIVEKAVEISSDEMASSSSRLTALRLSAMTEGSESATGVARSLAQTGETILLRSAAIVTLGETGTADDRELLQSYTLSDNRQIAAAAKMALQKLEPRLTP